jgi:hypothetical protein
MATVPVIIDCYPAPNAVGIPIGDQFTVAFDQEMDEDSINTGTFVVVAPDRGVLFMGAELAPFDEPGLDDEELLNSPYYGGYLQGSISFSRVDTTGSPIDDDAVDYDGLGTLWRTVATFTPSGPLIPNKNYKILVAGDEDTTNRFNSGVKTRTVFDPEPTITGTGSITSSGGYTGDVNRVYVVEIQSGGSTGTATYLWWNQVDALITYQGITTTGKRELEDGVCIFCDPDGTFVAGDSWTITCIPAIALPNTYEWSFSTGSGSILTPPSTSSASGIDTLVSDSDGDTSTSLFGVDSIDPEGGEYGVVISTDPYLGETIVIEFTELYPIDSSTVSSSTVIVRSEPANGDTDILSTETLDYTITVGTNTITIQLDPGQLYENNIVIIELDKSIADTQGNTIGADYTSYFSTPYTPIYSSLRRIRLDLGTAISDVRDETIMLAILEASLKADALVFVSVSSVNTSFRNIARKEYVTCLAELMLIRALSTDLTSSNKMSKSLGDLSVSRTGVGKGLEDRMKQLQDCVNYWQIAVESNGQLSAGTSLAPTFSVKGALASDAITVSRQWEPVSHVGHHYPGVNTTEHGANSRRRVKTFRSRNHH